MIQTNPSKPHAFAKDGNDICYIMSLAYIRYLP